MNPAIVWPWQNAGHLFSLADMLQFPIKGLVEATDGLRGTKSFLDTDGAAVVHENVIKSITRHLSFLGLVSDSLKLVASKDRCLQFYGRIQVSELPWEDPLTAKEACREIEGILESLSKELSEIAFVHIENDRVKFLNKEHLFGRGVTKAFPSAVQNIADAGNCMATGLNTAAVFHLMCVLDVGIKAANKHLKTNIRNPDEHDWAPLLNAINKKLETSHQKARSKKKRADLEFYTSLVAELRALKEVHRNQISHAKRRYNESEALGVFARVKDFMERLSSRVSEQR